MPASLTATSDIVRMRLASAHTTTAPSYHTTSKILTTASGALGGLARKAGSANGTTNVTIVDSPDASSDIQVNTITIHNLDTVSHTVTIEFYDGSTATRLKRTVLATGEHLEWAFPNPTWNIYNVDGLRIGETGTTGAAGADGVASLQEAEIDFGSTWTYSKEFTVTDAGVGPSDKILAVHSAVAATGRVQDENEEDALVLRCVAGTGNFTVYANSVTGRVRGKYKITYLVS